MALPERHNLYQTSSEQQADSGATWSSLGQIASSVSKSAGGIAKHLADDDKLLTAETQMKASVAAAQDWEDTANRYKDNPDSPKFLDELEKKINTRYDEAKKLAPDTGSEDLEKARIAEVGAAQKRAIKWKGDIKALKAAAAKENLINNASKWAFQTGAEGRSNDFSAYVSDVVAPAYEDFDEKLAPDEAARAKSSLSKNMLNQHIAGVVSSNPEKADAILNGEDSTEINAIMKEYTPKFAEEMKRAETYSLNAQIEKESAARATYLPSSKNYKDSGEKIEELKQRLSKVESDKEYNNAREMAARASVQESLKQKTNPYLQKALGLKTIEERRAENEKFRYDAAAGMQNPDVFLDLLSSKAPNEWIGEVEKARAETLNAKASELFDVVKQYKNNIGKVSPIIESSGIASSQAISALQQLANTQPDERTGSTDELVLTGYKTQNALRNMEMSESDYQAASGIVTKIIQDKEFAQNFQALVNNKDVNFTSSFALPEFTESIADEKVKQGLRTANKQAGVNEFRGAMDKATLQGITIGADALARGVSFQDAMKIKTDFQKQAFNNYYEKKGMNLSAMDEKLANKEKVMATMPNGKTFEYVGRDNQNNPMFKNPYSATLINMIQSRMNALNTTNSGKSKDNE